MTLSPRAGKQKKKKGRRFISSVRKRCATQKKIRTGEGRKGDIGTKNRKHQEEETIKKELA